MRRLVNMALTLALGAPLVMWLQSPWYANVAIGGLISMLVDIWRAK